MIIRGMMSRREGAAASQSPTPASVRTRRAPKISLKAPSVSSQLGIQVSPSLAARSLRIRNTDCNDHRADAHGGEEMVAVPPCSAAYLDHVRVLASHEGPCYWNTMPLVVDRHQRE